MKKVLCLLLVLAMAMGCAGLSVSAAEYGIVLNNNVALVVGNTTAVAHNALQTLSVAPTEVDGYVLIPVRSITELLGGSVSYDGASNTVDISLGADKKVVLRVGSTQYTINGHAYDFPVAPQIIDGSTMVPMETFVKNILGETLFYDQATKLAIISSRKVIKDSVTDAAVISTIASAIASQNLPTISVPTSYQLDWGSVSGNGSSNYDVGQLNFVSVTASAEPEPANSASNLIDGSASTFWAIGDNGGDAVCDLGKVNAITEIKVAFAKYNERAANYEIYASENGSSYKQIFSGASTQGQQWDSHTVDGSAYRYIKIVSNGNSTGSTWNSIAEVQAYNGSSGATTVVAATGAKITPSSATATAEPEAENNAAKTIDGDSSTYWAAQGEASVTLDLGSAQTVSSVTVRMRTYEDGRSINYGVAYSSDGSSYTSVYDGQSESGGGVDETHAVGASARYIRINVNGSTTGEWASVSEIEVYGAATASTTTTTSASGSKLTASSVTATSEPEAENNANNAIDGDSSTYWATQDAQSLTLDLGSAKTVSSVVVRMRNYDDGRSVNYGVSYSSDGSSYTSVYDGQSEAGGGVNETHTVGASARYIRVSVNGSTTNGWASVAEVEVYGDGGTATTASTTTTTTSASGSKLTASSITATSEPEAENNANKTVDGDASTYWATQGSQSVTYDLGSAKTVSSVTVRMRTYEDGRSINYGIAYSSDGSSYTSVYDGQSESGGGVDEAHTVGASARYIRITVNGSTTGEWASVSEVEIYGDSGTSSTDDSTVSLASTGELTNMKTVSGEFVIAVQSSGKVLTVSSDNCNLSTAENTGASNQVWTLSGNSIKNKGCGYCLDVSGQSYDEGGQIIVWESNGGTNQSWTLENEGDYYYIKSDMSGLYLASTAAGIVQNSKTSATKWIISK